MRSDRRWRSSTTAHADYAGLDVLSLIADNSWKAGVVLGEFVRPWPDLAGVEGVVSVDGKVADRASGASSRPSVSIRWRGSRAISPRQGSVLRAGDIVMTGNLVTTRFPDRASAYRFEAAGLGAVELTIGSNRAAGFLFCPRKAGWQGAVMDFGLGNKRALVTGASRGSARRSPARCGRKCGGGDLRPRSGPHRSRGQGHRRHRHRRRSFDPQAARTDSAARSASSARRHRHSGGQYRRAARPARSIPRPTRPGAGFRRLVDEHRRADPRLPPRHARTAVGTHHDRHIDIGGRAAAEPDDLECASSRPARPGQRAQPRSGRGGHTVNAIMPGYTLTERLRELGIDEQKSPRRYRPGGWGARKNLVRWRLSLPRSRPLTSAVRPLPATADICARFRARTHNAARPLSAVGAEQLSPEKLPHVAE